MRVRDAVIRADRARARCQSAGRNRPFYRRQAKRAERRLGQAIIRESLVELDGDAVHRRIVFNAAVTRRSTILQNDLWLFIECLNHPGDVI